MCPHLGVCVLVLRMAWPPPPAYSPSRTLCPFSFLSLLFLLHFFLWPSLSLTIVLSFLMTVLVYVSSESHLHKGQTNPGWGSKLLCSSLVFSTGIWVHPLASSLPVPVLSLLWNSALCFFRSILCCFSHYGNVFSLANMIKISSDVAHLVHRCCLASSVLWCIRDKSFTHKQTHTHTHTHTHTGSAARAWVMPDPIYPEGFHDCRVVKAISAEQDLYLSLSAVKNKWLM